MASLHVPSADSPDLISVKRLSWHLLLLKIRENIQAQKQKSLQAQKKKSVNFQEQNGEQQTHSELGTIEESPREEVPEKSVICLIDNLEESLREDNTTKWGKLCIYRIPGYLREKNEWYYPQTISIGPYHYGREHLRPMDRHKYRAVNMVLKRTKLGIKMYIDAMKELEEKARACYEGHIGLNSKDFTEMLLRDGCFVLEYMRGVVHEFPKLEYADNDPVFAARGSMHSIQRDMIMLENQLPLFVLNRLLVVQGIELSVPELAVRFFKRLMPLTHSPPTNDAFKPFAGRNGLHLLNVYRRSLLELKPELLYKGKIRWCTGIREAEKRQQDPQRKLYRVTELRDAGIKFKKLETDQFWDIKFENGFLQIPKLLIHDGTKSLLWNLVTFEQCHVNLNNDITVYIDFMDNLIDSSEDVSYLRQCGIIEHSLDSDSEVADIFNRLCKDVVFNTCDNYLSKVSKKLHDCYKSKYFRNWNAWKRALRHKYFDNPWAYFSFFAAVMLLVLTLLQTLFTVYAYYKPPSQS